MNKFLSILKISFTQEITYKLSFVMWRLRNIVQIVVFFYLWKAALQGSPNGIFGYTSDKIFTYAFALIVVRAIVLSTRSVDVANLIAKGDLVNLLLKPVNFFKYWLVRDFGSKMLNVGFGVFEVVFLVLVLQPNIFIQTNPLFILAFIISLIIACFIYFCLLMCVNFVPFWLPEISWGAQFLFSVVMVEFLSGSFFPLDVFPTGVFNFLMLTPFPYMIFVPVKFYLGAYEFIEIVQYLSVGLIWCFASWKLMTTTWRKGLLIWEGAGK